MGKIDSAINLALIAGLEVLNAPGQSDIVTELIETFLHDSRQRTLQLKLSMSEARWPAAIHESHRLKSAAAALGAEQLAQTCEEVEYLLVKGDYPKAQAAYANFDRHFGSAVVALTNLLLARSPFRKSA